MQDKIEQVQRLIRKVPDFPKPGILFYDLSTLLQDRHGFRLTIDLLEESLKGVSFELIAGIDSRGFIFGAALADRFGTGLVLIRKPGKLPGVTRKIEYALEYGSSALEICEGAIKGGERILLVDDLLATGGTARAAIDLIEREAGVVVRNQFLIELEGLGGREKLKPRECHALLKV